MIYIQNIKTFEALRELDDIAWDVLEQGLKAFKKYFPESKDFILELEQKENDDGDYFKLDVVSDLTDEDQIKVQFEQVTKNWWDQIPEEIRVDFEIGVSYK